MRRRTPVEKFLSTIFPGTKISLSLPALEKLWDVVTCCSVMVPVLGRCRECSGRGRRAVLRFDSGSILVEEESGKVKVTLRDHTQSTVLLPVPRASLEVQMRVLSMYREVLHSDLVRTLDYLVTFIDVLNKTRRSIDLLFQVGVLSNMYPPFLLTDKVKIKKEREKVTVVAVSDAVETTDKDVDAVVSRLCQVLGLPDPRLEICGFDGTLLEAVAFCGGDVVLKYMMLERLGHVEVSFGVSGKVVVERRWRGGGGREELCVVLRDGRHVERFSEVCRRLSRIENIVG